MSKIIKKCDEVCGYRYWRQTFLFMVPKMEVFKVVGHNPDTGVYYFQLVRDKKTITGRSFYQLFQNGFEPFLIPGGLEESPKQPPPPPVKGSNNGPPIPA